MKELQLFIKKSLNLIEFISLISPTDHEFAVLVKRLDPLHRKELASLTFKDLFVEDDILAKL